MHGHTALLSALYALTALVIASTVGARPLSAQARAQDSTAQSPPHRLAPVIISAPTRSDGVVARLGARHRITALERENRSLSLLLARQDREIVRLEARLHHLKTVKTDSLQRRIALLDSATAATRAERLRLEARLKALGGKL